MSAVLGVSVGASAVRMATPAALNKFGPPAFHRQDIAGGSAGREEHAARSIGVLLEHNDHAYIGATAVACGTARQAEAMHEAMAAQRLHNYQLVPDTTAAITLLEATDQLGDARTLVLYDLGSSGVTVSVVDRYTRAPVAVERSTVAGGDQFDLLIRDQQSRDQDLAVPANEWAAAELVRRCRAAKEQLAESDAVCLPGDGGLILLTRERFESVVAVPIEGSARLAREVIAASGRRPDLLVMLGGGARIPLVQSVLRSWLALPMVVPVEPEMVTAQGAALLARPIAAPEPVGAGNLGSGHLGSGPRADPPARGRVSKRQLAIAGIAAAGLLAVAGVGLVLGQVSDGNQGEGGTTVATEGSVPPGPPAPVTTVPAPSAPPPAPDPVPDPAPEIEPAHPAASEVRPPPPPPPPPRYLNLPQPIQIEVPPGIALPPGMIR